MNPRFLRFPAAAREILRAGARALRRAAYSSGLPQDPRHDDLYLVTFPRSGTTWLSFLLANVHTRMSETRRQVTYFNVPEFIPEVTSRWVGDGGLRFPGYRVIKSHSEYNPFYERVLYLVRDPRDVLVSYYHFLHQQRLFEGPIEAFVDSRTVGIDAWVRHVSGWMTRTPAAVSFQVIKYEDLLANTAGVLRRIYTLLGHEVPDAILDAAIDAASFDNMKKSEQFYGYGGREAVRLEFMRHGKSGGFRAELSESLVLSIEDRARDWLKAFGYALAPSPNRVGGAVGNSPGR